MKIFDGAVAYLRDPYINEPLTDEQLARKLAATPRGMGIRCRVSRMNDGFYCDSCGSLFDDREKPPCGEKALPHG